MSKKAVWIGMALALLGVVATSGTARADELNKKTMITFSQPVEIPGHVLPAGTYTFKLADSLSDRHIVQIFNADGSDIIATFIAISDYRLKPTGETVIRFKEVPAGSPQAIRAWFYPGNNFGQEFVYPKQRAAELARASDTVVPAVATDMASDEDLKTAPIVAVTPQQKDADVATAIQTTPLKSEASDSSSMMNEGTGDQATGQMAERNTGHLPKTASDLPLIALLGFGSMVIAFMLMLFGKRETVPVFTR
ncbi:MAG TPA: hypothetical protein VND92_00290 [Vicinamibacterales bacterium]|nr:hypothetical protein [Vicinamibacterales bacterium]